MEIFNIYNIKEKIKLGCNHIIQNKQRYKKIKVLNEKINYKFTKVLFNVFQCTDVHTTVNSKSKGSLFKHIFQLIIITKNVKNDT